MTITNNAAGNGLYILKHKTASGKIRQSQNYSPKTRVSYRIVGRLENKPVSMRATWLRNTPPPRAFVDMGIAMGFLNNE